MRAARTWPGSSRLGLPVTALAVGVGAGFGAVGFRLLIYGCTWLATGHEQFGQQGRVGSLHFPSLGIWFLLLAPIAGGLLYGPLIQRFAEEARGHGVPEVMLAVAESGGRIRPRVTIVKAVGSAVCIGVGGSVGREGPIVQIGSAFASTLGQAVGMSEARLRTIVACGAAGGIAATFNAPVTGLFFGLEIVLREFSLDALFATILSAVTADLVSRAFFGSAPFFSAMPHHLVLAHPYGYLLIALLGVATGLVGAGFKSVLYRLEGLADVLWRGRPEWARPAVGGIALGLVLLALPQLYGVGYPVIGRVVAGHIVLWFVVALMLGKIVAAGLTLAIGGSGGVFAPSLFTGAMGGMAFGVVAHDLFGAGVGSPAVYGVVAMGGVFGGAAQAPLTAIASVVEMTGDFALTLPVMLVVGIAAALSRRLSYGSIYTTKLLWRGVDIERPRPAALLETLTVADVMRLLPAGREGDPLPLLAAEEPDPETDAPGSSPWPGLVGTVTGRRRLEALVADETLGAALRQLVADGRWGLPVLSSDRRHLQGWLTAQTVLRALARSAGAPAGALEQGVPLDGYQLVEITLGPRSPGAGHRIREIAWPPGCVAVAVTDGREIAAVGDDATLRSGERLFVLAPAQSPPGRVVSSAAAAAAPIDQVEDGPPLRRHEGCPATPTKESM